MPDFALDNAPIKARYITESKTVVTVSRNPLGRYAITRTTASGGVENSVVALDKLSDGIYLAEERKANAARVDFGMLVFKPDGKIEERVFPCTPTIERTYDAVFDEAEEACYFDDYSKIVAAAKTFAPADLELNAVYSPN